jgi:hypothetical protein
MKQHIFSAKSYKVNTGTAFPSGNPFINYFSATLRTLLELSQSWAEL